MLKIIRSIRRNMYVSFLQNYCFSIHSVILCGMKKEIDEDDVNLATKLCDTKVTGVHERRKMIEEMKNEINKQSITELANKELNHINRYMPGCFPHRSYTYISGEEAYEEVPKLLLSSLFLMDIFIIVRAKGKVFR